MKDDFIESSKILLDTELKIILLFIKNNEQCYKKIWKQLVWTFYIIILIIQQNYFSDLYLAEILDLSAKPFFP